MPREWRCELVDPPKGTGYVIRCAKCKKASVIHSKMGPALAAEKAPVTFRRRGWQIGSSPEHDYCFECVGKFKAIKHTIAQKEKAMANVTPIRAEAPEPMSKADRRVIFNKLEEVYVDENVGYSKGWDDQKVATDLGVPLAWVSEVREQNFGPNKSEDMTKMFEEARTLLEELKVVWGRAEVAKNVFKTEHDNIVKMETRMQRVERLLGDFAKRCK